MHCDGAIPEGKAVATSRDVLQHETGSRQDPAFFMYGQRRNGERTHGKHDVRFFLNELRAAFIVWLNLHLALWSVS